MYKIMAILIKAGELSEQVIVKIYHCRFRSNGSVIDQIFVLMQIQTNCYNRKMALHKMFIQRYMNLAYRENTRQMTFSPRMFWPGIYSLIFMSVVFNIV